MVHSTVSWPEKTNGRTVLVKREDEQPDQSSTGDERIATAPSQAVPEARDRGGREPPAESQSAPQPGAGPPEPDTALQEGLYQAWTTSDLVMPPLAKLTSLFVQTHRVVSGSKGKDTRPAETPAWPVCGSGGSHAKTIRVTHINHFSRARELPRAPKAGDLATPDTVHM